MKVRNLGINYVWSFQAKGCFMLPTLWYFVEFFLLPFFLFPAILRVFLRELAIKIITLCRGNYLNTTWECVDVFCNPFSWKKNGKIGFVSLQIKYIAWSQLMPTRKGKARENIWWEKPIYPHKNIYDIVSGSSQRRTKDFRQHRVFYFRSQFPFLLITTNCYSRS